MMPGRFIVLQLLFTLGFRSSVAEYGRLECLCEPVSAEICTRQYKYSTTFPNKVNGFSSVNDALREFESFPIGSLALQTCSSMLVNFICFYYFPPCLRDLDCKAIGPCDSLCEQVRLGCEPLLLKNNYTWPDHLDCSKFPSSDSESAYSGSAYSGSADSETADPYCIPAILSASTPTPDPTLVEATLPTMPGHDVCESFLPEVSEICGGIHPNYNLTHFPYGQFTSQKQAIETIKNLTEYSTYLELIDHNCAAELKPFLCLHFFPQCTPTQPITLVKPCRSVCRRARNGCSPCLKEFEWHFDCDDYQVKGACVTLDDLKCYIRKLTSRERNC